MDNQFGNVSLFTLGSVPANWKSPNSDGIMSAADGVSIPEATTIRFAIATHLNEDGTTTGKVSFIKQGSIKTLELATFVFEITNLLPDLTQNQRAIIGNIFFKSLFEDNFIPKSEEVGIATVAEGGEIRLTDGQESDVPGSTLICVSCYPECIYTLDDDSSYGINLSDQEPDECRDYGALIFEPNAKLIEAELHEAIEYLNEISSVGLLLELVEKWNIALIPPFDKAWQLIQENLENELAPATHISAAHIAKFVLNDESLYISILNRLQILADSGAISYPFATTEIAAEWAESNYKPKTQIISLLETCITKLDNEDPDEMCDFIEEVGNPYCRLKLGELGLAERALTETLSRINDKKILSKFKIRGEKILKNF